MKSLTDTNKQLHKKMAQMRASIEIGTPYNEEKKIKKRASSQTSSNKRLRIGDGDSSIESIKPVKTVKPPKIENILI